MIKPVPDALCIRAFHFVCGFQQSVDSRGALENGIDQPTNTGSTVTVDSAGSAGEKEKQVKASHAPVSLSYTDEAAGSLRNIRIPSSRSDFGLGMVIHLVKFGMVTARSTPTLG